MIIICVCKYVYVDLSYIKTKTTMEAETKQIRDELKELGLRHVKYLFTLKFPEYAWGEFRDDNYHKLDNLWFGKVKDEDFLNKMKAFLRYAKQCKN